MSARPEDPIEKSPQKNALAAKQDFFDKPQNVTLILRGFYVICILLVVADFVVHRHIYLRFEEIPAFYAIYGFVACVVLVVIAKEMRKIFMKDETYYDDREDEDDMPVAYDEVTQDLVVNNAAADDEDISKNTDCSGQVSREVAPK